jgi:hypothetical protein
LQDTFSVVSSFRPVSAVGQPLPKTSFDVIVGDGLIVFAVPEAPAAQVVDERVAAVLGIKELGGCRKLILGIDHHPSLGIRRRNHFKRFHDLMHFSFQLVQTTNGVQLVADFAAVSLPKTPLDLSGKFLFGPRIPTAVCIKLVRSLSPLGQHLQHGVGRQGEAIQQPHCQGSAGSIRSSSLLGSGDGLPVDSCLPLPFGQRAIDFQDLLIMVNGLETTTDVRRTVGFLAPSQVSHVGS